MDLENSVKDIIKQKMEDGTVEKLVSESVEAGIKKALDGLIGYCGDVTKIIEKQLKSVLVPYLEGYDYSQYIIKLDGVLTELLQSAGADNRKLLENFKGLMGAERPKTITATELFELWQKHVAENVETDGLDIDYDDQPSYSCVDVSFDISENDKPSWSCFSSSLLVFECEHDDSMNREIRLSRYESSKDGGWDIQYGSTCDIPSLRYLSKFDVAIMNLSQCGTKLIVDCTSGTEEVRPDKEPEASFN